MRKKHKHYQSPAVRIEPLPKAFVASVSLSNIQEQKTQFLEHGKTPVFVVHGGTSAVEELASKSSGRIRFELLGEAEYILRKVKEQYGVGENYLEHIYGPRIEQDEANAILFDYIRENSLQESLAVYWSNEMTCSARMMWKGYSFKANKPEARRYSLWLNGTAENPYLRQQGLWCLLDHEIGTHFYRSYNDGFQPWFSDRKRFGLRGCGSFESLCTEEGLAAINATLRAKEKYLWLSALTYYTACKSTEMTFKQLFDHLEQFVQNPEQRWKHVMRVKRWLLDPNDLGGYGKDQCYFEGAVLILRNIDDINFNLLMSGKICYDEASRVKRLARLGSVCLPAIMRDMDTYRKQLTSMAVINGLHLSHPTYDPSPAYLRRLKERQAGVHHRRKVRQGKELRGSLSHSSSSDSSLSKSHGVNESHVEAGAQAADKSVGKDSGPLLTSSSSNSSSGFPDSDLPPPCLGLIRKQAFGCSKDRPEGSMASGFKTSSDNFYRPEISGSLLPAIPGSQTLQDAAGSQCTQKRRHSARETGKRRLPPLCDDSEKKAANTTNSNSCNVCCTKVSCSGALRPAPLNDSYFAGESCFSDNDEQLEEGSHFPSDTACPYFCLPPVPRQEPATAATTPVFLVGLPKRNNLCSKPLGDLFKLHHTPW